MTSRPAHANANAESPPRPRIRLATVARRVQPADLIADADVVITRSGSRVAQRRPRLADVAQLWRSMVEACVDTVLLPAGCARDTWRRRSNDASTDHHDVCYRGPWVECVSDLLVAEMRGLEVPSGCLREGGELRVSHGSSDDTEAIGQEVSP